MAKIVHEEHGGQPVRAISRTGRAIQMSKPRALLELPAGMRGLPKFVDLGLPRSGRRINKQRFQLSLSDRFRGQGAYARASITAFGTVFNPPAERRVFEFGAGTGHDLLKFRRAGWNVAGLCDRCKRDSVLQ